MSEQDFNELFAKNLNFYLTASGKTQADLAKYIGVSTASVSNWCKGIKLPRMDKVDKMCLFFQVNRSDLMQEHVINASAAKPTLTPDESDLLSNYQKLNDYGKEEARKQVRNLSRLDEYKKGHDAPGSENAAG